MLQDITPVLLTYNEAPNIRRTLSHLGWARTVVVVDSGSSDGTLDELARWPNVQVFSRPFDTHANQWRYAESSTGITTSWILRLDADYQVNDELVEELRTLNPEAEINAYSIAFDYAIFSRKLRASLYPRNTLLLRRGHFSVRDNGHTESWFVDGVVKDLRARVLHNDWKDAQFWLSAQNRYMSRELGKISENGRLRLRDRLRLIPPLMPISIFLYCLFGKGLILNGRAGLYYALQRLVAEGVLSLMVLEKVLRPKNELTQAQLDVGNGPVPIDDAVHSWRGGQNKDG
jgi:glycosyltransferase involved in cell wall biosynthesis